MPAMYPASTRVTLLHRLNENPTDRLSWSEFVQLYGPIIRGWCLHWGLQESDAEDVTQNVLLRLTSKLPQFKYDQARSFRGWLKTLTHHAWHDFITETGYRHRGSGDSVIQDQLQSVAARDDLAARMEATFDKEMLEIAINRVRERVAETTWEAFRLTAFEQESANDVAEKLAIRVSQVYLAKHRVQKLLQQEIAVLEGNPVADAGLEGDPESVG
jgi:RNA polymerase sigma factor (sigma-70 family)